MARTDSSLYEYMYAIYIYLFILNSEQSILFQRPDFWCLLRYLSETVAIFVFRETSVPSKLLPSHS